MSCCSKGPIGRWPREPSAHASCEYCKGCQPPAASLALPTAGGWVARVCVFKSSGLLSVRAAPGVLAVAAGGLTGGSRASARLHSAPNSALTAALRAKWSPSPVAALSCPCPCPCSWAEVREYVGWAGTSWMGGTSTKLSGSCPVKTCGKSGCTGCMNIVHQRSLWTKVDEVMDRDQASFMHDT